MANPKSPPRDASTQNQAMQPIRLANSVPLWTGGEQQVSAFKQQGYRKYDTVIPA